MAYTRREFAQGLGAAGIAMSIENASGQQNAAVPKRPLGKTGLQVSALGVGGFHLGTADSDQEANQIVGEAIDAGINFFDNAWEYHDGKSEIRLGNALKGKRDQAILMTKVCTHGRKKDVAMRMLEESLNRLQTDHLDIWQVHEVVYYNDPDLIFAKDGVIEALDQAKQQGKVRFVGFTGHKDPSIHLKMLSHGYAFDTVQMPLNCFDASYRSFETQVLPEVNRRGMAALGMKSMGGSGESIKNGAVTAQEALRYAMSMPVAVTIAGMETVSFLHQNLEVARGFQAAAPTELTALRNRVRMYAADGRFELFKSTVKYDGALGREQHGFPTPAMLPA